jgi:hypothetical protein
MAAGWAGDEFASNAPEGGVDDGLEFEAQPAPNPAQPVSSAVSVTRTIVDDM